MFEGFQETYEYGGDDFVNEEDGLDVGAPSLSRSLSSLTDIFIFIYTMCMHGMVKS